MNMVEHFMKPVPPVHPHFPYAVIILACGHARSCEPRLARNWHLRPISLLDGHVVLQSYLPSGYDIASLPWKDPPCY